MEYITKKMKQNLGMMKKIKGSVPKDSLVTLYKTLVELYLGTVTLFGVNVETPLLKNCKDFKTKLQELYLEQALRRLTMMTY